MAETPDVPEGAAVFPLIPPELGVQPWLLATLHAFVFLDGSDESVLDPDAAGEALEYLTGYVQRLSGVELRRAREDLETLVAFGRSEKWPRENVEFLQTFLDHCGVAPESKK
jgi:hypothetical protein